jgi:hypothetical protein
LKRKETVFLLSIYDKNVQTEISDKELKGVYRLHDYWGHGIRGTVGKTCIQAVIRKGEPCNVLLNRKRKQATKDVVELQGADLVVVVKKCM